jgi:hypothetical protein
MNTVLLLRIVILLLTLSNICSVSALLIERSRFKKQIENLTEEKRKE